VIVAARRKEDRPGLAFLAGGFFLALAPALPLSISLVNTLSERYIYLTTVFSCTVVAWALVRLTPLPTVGFSAVVLFSLLQWHSLIRANDGWRRGGEVFRSVVAGVLDVARQSPAPGITTVLLLNAPDTVHRPHVDAGGMLADIHLTTTASGEHDPDVRIAAMADSTTGRDAVTVRQDARRFDVDLAGSALFDDWPTDQREFAVVKREPHAFAIVVKPGPSPLLVAYTSADGVRRLTTIGGIPFGFIDAPAEDVARCVGASILFSGWALDDRPGVSVRAEADAVGGSRWLGIAEWRRRTRPDVTNRYRGYPDADRAEWDVMLPCPAVPSDGAPLRLHVIARDTDGQEVELGTRTVIRRSIGEDRRHSGVK
jgi:hypothetical protein